MLKHSQYRDKELAIPLTAQRQETQDRTRQEYALAMARRKATQKRLLIHDNVDPIEAKQQARAVMAKNEAQTGVDDSLKAMDFTGGDS